MKRLLVEILKFTGDFCEISDIKEKYVFGNWRKGGSYKVVDHLAELYSSVWWKVESVYDELKYFTEEISKQNVEDTSLGSPYCL